MVWTPHMLAGRLQLEVGAPGDGSCGPRVSFSLEMDDEPPAEHYDIPETMEGVRCSSANNARMVAIAKPIGVSILGLPIQVFFSGVCFRLPAPPSGCHGGGLGGPMFRLTRSL